MPKALIWVLAALVIAGVIAHLKILFSLAGTIDSDEAILGLMATHLKRGEISALYWGQAYGGSHEALIAGVLFWIFGVSSILLKLVPISLHAAAAILIWRVGRLTMSEAAARIGGTLAWVWPPFLMFWSVKVGIYMAAICIALLALLYLLRMTSKETWPVHEACLFGFFAGNAFWANPQTLYMLIPASAFFLRKFLFNWKRLPLIALFALVGSLPWIAFNIRHDWASFDIPPQPESTYLGNLDSFFRRMLPMVLGLRVAYSGNWVLSQAGKVAYLGLILLMVLAIWKRPKDIRLHIFVFVIYPLMFSLSPYSWFQGEPRYLLMLVPSASLMVGYALVRLFADRPLLQNFLAPAAAVAGASAIALLVPLFQLTNRPESQRAATDRPVPVSFEPLEDLLEREKVKYAYSDYWIAYRATFEFQEKIIVAPYYVVRYSPYNAKVHALDSPPFIFLADSGQWPAFQELAKVYGVNVTSRRSGEWLVAYPEKPISPDEFAEMTGH